MENPSPQQKMIFDADQLHAALMDCIQKAFEDLQSEYESEFADKWHGNQRWANSRTAFRHIPLLGKGLNGRSQSGFYTFAEEYIKKENPTLKPANVIEEIEDRCFFKYYNDVNFYVYEQDLFPGALRGFKISPWRAGRKRLLLAAEIENKSYEIYGQIAKLLTFNCAIKYLFVSFFEKQDTLKIINDFTSNFGLTDNLGTTWFIVELPEHVIGPKDWKTYKSHIKDINQRLDFVEYN